MISSITSSAVWKKAFKELNWSALDNSKIKWWLELKKSTSAWHHISYQLLTLLMLFRWYVICFLFHYLLSESSMVSRWRCLIEIRGSQSWLLLSFCWWTYPKCLRLLFGRCFTSRLSFRSISYLLFYSDSFYGNQRTFSHEF